MICPTSSCLISNNAWVYYEQMHGIFAHPVGFSIGHVHVGHVGWILGPNSRASHVFFFAI